MNARLIVIPFVIFMPLVAGNTQSSAAAPNPVLNVVFPAGGSAGGSIGQTAEVTVAGVALAEVSLLRCTAPGVTFEPIEGNKNQFRVSIAPDTPLGHYDLRAICSNGISSPRSFVIGKLPEQLESEPNDRLQSAPCVPLNCVVNGRIEKSGDLDYFRFEAKRGQRILIECSAERIDSQLRAVLELFSDGGKLLASSRGYFGIDPLIDFVVPADGPYLVKLHDLIHSGGPAHYYRLDIDTGPRVAFALPTVVQQGQPARVTLYGWNLDSRNTNAADSSFDRIEVDLPATMTRDHWPLPFRMHPTQTTIRGFPYQLPGSHAPVFVGVTDVPVSVDAPHNHSSDAAQVVTYPCEVSGQLSAGDEQDWFAIDAKRGEVLYIEGFAQRINSPVDLDVRVLDADSREELVHLGDQSRNVGGKSFPTNHVDPVGRWRVPANGRYLILVRNVIGGLRSDPRRRYRLSIRREEPDFGIAVVPHRNDPAGVNIQRDGRTLLNLVATRSRGQTADIRVSVKELPEGVTCPDVWLGPGIDRAPLVISAGSRTPEFFGDLVLEGIFDVEVRRRVRGGVVVRDGSPIGWGRLTSDIPLAIVGEAPIRISANGHEMRDHHLFGKLEVRHSPGSILDVAVHVERRDTSHQADVKLTAVGLPELIDNQAAIIPSGTDRGYISFYLPPSLPIGRYSLAIQGETTIPSGSDTTEAVTIYSDVVSFDVHEPAFQIEVDRFSPKRIRRGEVLQVNYHAHRMNGFINKIHTELASPGKVTDVEGLRGRGVTFVGQTDAGTIQIIANADAPLGQLPFLRLYGVGVVEDEALHHGSCFLDLEVVE